MLQTKTENFWDSVRKYPAEHYNGVRLDKLVTVAMLKLEEGGLETNFDNIVVILHKLFPDKFSLLSFPEYPDSIRVDNTLRLDCRHSKFLTGNRIKGFHLTTLGRIAGEETFDDLETRRGRDRAVVERKDMRRNIAVRSITAVAESEAFQKFSNKQYAEIRKFDICEVLHGTLDTSEEKLRNNFAVLRKYANDIGNSSQFKDLSLRVTAFFDYVEKHWEVLMHE